MATKAKPTVGSLIDQLSEIRDKRRDIAAQDKALSKDYEGLEAQLIALMDAEGLSKSTGKLATASISESMQFSTSGEGADWDTFMAYVAKKKFFHLVQRRVSAPAIRELWEKAPVPGLATFTKREVGLRNL